MEISAKKSMDYCDPENLSPDSGHVDIMLKNIGINDINPVVAGQYNCKPNYSYGPKIRRYYLLHYVVSGKGVYKVMDKTYKLQRGDIFISAPNTEIYYKADGEDPWHYRWVGFNCNLKIVPRFLDNAFIKAPESDYIFRSMMNAEHFSGSQELYICAKIFELFALMESKAGDKENNVDNYINLAKHYIENNYNDSRLSISFLAKKLHLDRCYLSTIFKKCEGISPQQYLQNYRLNMALDLLTRNELKIEEISSLCGYNSSFHFSKMFKAKFGHSPSQKRKITNVADAI